MIRCSATVSTHSGWGYYRDNPDPQCQRQATDRGLCTQHHRQLWKDHDRIVNRILEIPPRP